VSAAQASARVFVFAAGKLADSYLPPIGVPAVEVRAGAVVHLPISDRRAESRVRRLHPSRRRLPRR